MLLAIWKLFNLSQHRSTVFKDVQSAYGMRELVLIQAATARWLSHGGACKRLFDHYVQVTGWLWKCLQN